MILLIPVFGTGCHSKPTLPYGNDMKQAIESGNAATVQALINTGVDVNGRNELGDTPLADAANRSQATIIKILLDAGAKADTEGHDHWYPLNLIAGEGSPESLSLLVKAGADVNRRSPDGQTPLISSLTAGNEPNAVLLVEHGADVNARAADGESALINAARMPSGSGHPPLLGKMLLDRGATVPKDECKLLIVMYSREGDTNTANRISGSSSCQRTIQR
jgi:ankyrin repeat protein